MKTPTKPGMTVILEDAYKQNEVYRPWKDITSGKKLEEKPGQKALHTGARTRQPSLANAS